ncbi:ABC transporter permease [Lusitaniella coriacea LEGE 07157]|uniref:ABC transporter permease n=1 Tax=Lusitaniella coriacea LEGE 07157 TaxID=945747 RepID=A0A8J7IUT4_9CYAN|nr:ABC transporter permease [Lusitaniella coriacea]MBE9117902.1 ABC transporter permease [Lusitaniella coriacea LEGE 07157]
MPLSPLDLLHLTTDSLRGNPLRSALTTFGVFMGVAAVNATLQVANISTAVIERQLAEREAPQIKVSMWSREGKYLSEKEIALLKQQIAGIQAIGSLGDWLFGKVIFQDAEQESLVFPVSQNYFLISGRTLLDGRMFSPADFERYKPVAIIDRFLAAQLGLAEDAIARRVYFQGKPYTVVGVMETKSEFFGEEPRGMMLIPISFYQAMSGQRGLNGIQIRPQRLEEMIRLEEEVKQLLKQRFPNAEVWTWQNVEDILEQRETLTIASRGLLGVGAIALLVAGVGIANITVASVMERTKEIGLRRAIGATKQDILLQIILEAVLMSLIGGISAIAVVDGLSRVVANRFELPYNFEGSAAGLSLGAALLVGVGSSFLPAMRASQLEPVKALRSD